MARRNLSEKAPPQQNSSTKDAPQQSTGKGIVSLKLTYNLYKLLPNTTENAPVARSGRSNKGKGGRAEQLASVFHAIRPGEFKSNDSDKAIKASKSKVPASAPVNPMAPTEKRCRASAKVNTTYLPRAAVVTTKPPRAEEQCQVFECSSSRTASSVSSTPRIRTSPSTSTYSSTAIGYY